MKFGVFEPKEIYYHKSRFIPLEGKVSLMGPDPFTNAIWAKLNEIYGHESVDWAHSESQ